MHNCLDETLFVHWWLFIKAHPCTSKGFPAAAFRHYLPVLLYLNLHFCASKAIQIVIRAGMVFGPFPLIIFRDNIIILVLKKNLIINRPSIKSKSDIESVLYNIGTSYLSYNCIAIEVTLYQYCHWPLSQIKRKLLLRLIRISWWLTSDVLSL